MIFELFLPFKKFFCKFSKHVFIASHGKLLNLFYSTLNAILADAMSGSATTVNSG